MKYLAIALALLPINVEASELYAFFFCDRVTVYLGVVGSETLPATPYDLRTDSATAEFFARVVKELPVKDGKKVVYRIDIDRLMKYDCGVLT